MFNHSASTVSHSVRLIDSLDCSRRACRIHCLSSHRRQDEIQRNGAWQQSVHQSAAISCRQVSSGNGRYAVRDREVHAENTAWEISLRKIDNGLWCYDVLALSLTVCKMCQLRVERVCQSERGGSCCSMLTSFCGISRQVARVCTAYQAT